MGARSVSRSLGAARVLSLFLCVGAPAPKPPVVVRVDVEPVVVNVVADNFLCLTLDWWPSNKCDYGTCSWGQSSVLTVDLESPRLLLAVRALAPLVLRVGGSLSDLVTYDLDGVKAGSCKPFSLDNANSRIGFTDGCLSKDRYAQLHDFCKQTGSSMLFVLNALYGRQRVEGCCRECKRKWCNYTGRWDASNTRELIRHTFANALSSQIARPRLQVPYGFELGNELCGLKGLQAKFEAHSYAADYAHLRALIQTLWDENGGSGEPPRIAGPACEMQLDWYRAFVKSFQPDVLTHHAYLLGSGRMDSLREKVLDADFLNRAKLLAANATESMGPARGKALLWAGEAGGAYNSGQHYVTDTFLSNFWFLDQLGTFAAAGHHVFCRQTLVGGHYGLLNSYHRPLPDFWAGLLWRRLMGVRVLRVRSTLPSLRAYAHCSRAADDSEAQGGQVTFLFLNLAKAQPVTVEPFALAAAGLGAGAGASKALPIASEQRVYLVTSSSLDSIQVKLNGEPLSPDARTGEIPRLEPIVRKGGTALVVPPLSYLFVTMQVPQFAHRGPCGDITSEPNPQLAHLNAKLRAAATASAEQQQQQQASGARRPSSEKPAAAIPGVDAAAAPTPSTGGLAAGGAGAGAAAEPSASINSAGSGAELKKPRDESDGFFEGDEVDAGAEALLTGAAPATAAVGDASIASASREQPAVAQSAGAPGMGVAEAELQPRSRQIRSDASSLLVVGPACALLVLCVLLLNTRLRQWLRALLFWRRGRAISRTRSK